MVRQAPQTRRDPRTLSDSSRRDSRCLALGGKFCYCTSGRVAAPGVRGEAAAD
jgi:hypothetical protein